MTKMPQAVHISSRFNFNGDTLVRTRFEDGSVRWELHRRDEETGLATMDETHPREGMCGNDNWNAIALYDGEKWITVKAQGE